MKLAITKETRAHEKRVAASPETVTEMIALGLAVVIEQGAGVSASFTDAAYAAAGATIAPDPATALAGADLVLKVQLASDELAHLKPGAALIAMLGTEQIEPYAKAGLTVFGLDLVPRITRAQSLDALSSQAKLAGYRAVIEAASEYGGTFPAMMTAAGAIPPARVTVIGAGAAGLQAIATARSLGALVSAFDTRASARERIESLGAAFIEADGEPVRQRETIRAVLKTADIVICTVETPGERAPVLVTKDMIAGMKPGSVLVDLAIGTGGNAEGGKPGKTVTSPNGVRLVGPANPPSQVAVDASALYAKNVANFLRRIVDRETKGLKFDRDDEIVKATLVAHAGEIVHPAPGNSA